MGRLDGKVVVLSGAGRGMGAATARLFVQEGASVLIGDVLDAEGQALAGELGEKACFVRLDVTDEANWQAALAAAKESFGKVTGLVNYAGVIRSAAIMDMALADFELVLRVNMIGTFLGVKTVAPAIIEAGGGSIVNISSTSGMEGCNSLGAYTASKWGVRGFTRTAALELGHRGVRVNSIHPGGINTAMGNMLELPEEKMNDMYKMNPIQRIGRPDEIAKTALFLISDDASYLCGAELLVDGGMLAGHYYPQMPGAPAN